MKVFVVDTSALIRLYIPDGPIVEQLQDVIHDCLRGDSRILAPDLLLAEMAQVIFKKEASGFITPKDSNEIIDAILTLPISIVSHRELITPAMKIARQERLTIYDSLFLALARKHRADLITADNALLRAYE